MVANTELPHILPYLQCSADTEQLCFGTWNALQYQQLSCRALNRQCLPQEVMAGVHQFEYLVTATMQYSMFAADSAASKLLAEEAQEKAQAAAKKGKKKKKQTPKKLGQVASAALSFCLCLPVLECFYQT